MAYSVAVTSGKGGVGKTSIAINLGMTLSREGPRVCLLDTDFGLANAHILLGVNPEKTISDLLNDRATMSELPCNGPAGLKLVAGGSGLTDLLKIDENIRNQIIRSTDALNDDLDVLIVDVPAGASDSAIDIIAAADRVLVVLVGEPTSFTDAYTLIKACSLEKNTHHFSVVVNMASNANHAKDTFDRFKNITDRFLDIDLRFAGYLPLSGALRDSIVKRRPIMSENGETAETQSFKKLALTIAQSPENETPGLRFLGLK
ncbi:MAG: MinD/ParA family protein [Pseudomonadota bacterium]|nr:MinD/ParA family protein [Pseudomonadota bacterium]